MEHNGAGAATPTTANAVPLSREAGDKQTAEWFGNKTRSPHHSTEGGNYHWKEPPTGWGGNVSR